VVLTDSVIGLDIPVFDSLPHHSNSLYSHSLGSVAVNAFHVYFSILNMVMVI
jgi:hypothetical protein